MMWKPDLNLQCPAGRHVPRRSCAMAHRRILVRGKVTYLVMTTAVLAFLLIGSIHVSNQASLLRGQISALESSQKFEEGRRAQLLTSWNHASAPETVIPRARREIGLELRDDPGLVLVQHTGSDGADGSGVLRRILSRFGGGEVQAAVQSTTPVRGTLVSLVPRKTSAAGAEAGTTR